MSKHSAQKFGSRYEYRGFWVKRNGPYWETCGFVYEAGNKNLVAPTLRDLKQKIDRYREEDDFKETEYKGRSSTGYRMLKEPGSLICDNERATMAGDRSRITLPDGTKITVLKPEGFEWGWSA